MTAPLADDCLVCTDEEFCAAHWPGDLSPAPCPVCYLPLAGHSVDQSVACDREKAALVRFERDQRDDATLDREVTA